MNLVLHAQMTPLAQTHFQIALVMIVVALQ